jgi:hypothetical protein
MQSQVNQATDSTTSSADTLANWAIIVSLGVGLTIVFVLLSKFSIISKGVQS